MAADTETDLQPKAAGWWPLVIIAAMVLLSDLTLYHTQGFFGPAVFFPLAAVLLVSGRNRVNLSVVGLLIGGLLIVLSVRLAWSGSAGQILVSLWLLNAFAMAIHGMRPYLLETVMFFASTIPGGYEFLHSIQVSWRRVVLEPVDLGKPSRFLNFALPVLSVVLFGTFFVMANPDLIKEVSSLLSDVFGRLRTWLMRYSFSEILFWCAVAWITAGLLFPFARWTFETVGAVESDLPKEDNHLFAPFRNTLLALIGLFSVYLVFEFRTLWFRSFPQGFHYSGYAHEGAAWLTAALALATVILSLMFRGTMMHHSRLAQLKLLAWVWSGLNLLLAMSVYNRLFIYIDYNGMTRMRTVGLLGISCVVTGFLLVLWKIVRRHSFHWLVQHQLLVPVFAVCLYVAAPVDSLVHRFNVSSILAGHPEPSVQISEHPIEDAALPVLIPLLSCNDTKIRDGVEALLHLRLQQLQSSRASESKQDWTAWQFGTEQAVRELEAAERRISGTPSGTEYYEARERFREYAMQWW